MVFETDDGGVSPNLHNVDARTPLTHEDKLFIMLQRHWSLIETIKGYRARFPFYVCGFLMAMTGFLLASKDVADVKPLRMFGALACIAVSALSCWALNVILERFLCIRKRIFHLYENLGMNSKDFYPDDVQRPSAELKNRDQSSLKLFYVAKTTVIVVGAICGLALFWTT